MAFSMSGSRRSSMPCEAKSTLMPERRARSLVTRRSVGARPRSSSTMGRISKMNSFVVSRACWTRRRSVATSSLARGSPLPTSRSTISACMPILAMDCAGPSCNWRTMFRRKSSWLRNTAMALWPAATVRLPPATASGRSPGDAVGAGRTFTPPMAARLWSISTSRCRKRASTRCLPSSTCRWASKSNSLRVSVSRSPRSSATWSRSDVGSAASVASSASIFPRRAAWRSISTRTCSMSMSISPFSPSMRRMSCSSSARSIKADAAAACGPGPGRTHVARGGRTWSARRLRWGVQSSGILIQPCFMA